MMIRKRKVRQILCAGLLCILLLSALGAPVSVWGEEQKDELNYGISGMNGQPTLDGVALLDQLFGITATEAEREYLQKNGLFTFTYRNVIPSEGISNTYNGEEGTLDLLVRPYTYTAANGSTVCWMPVSAEIHSVDNDTARQTIELAPDGEVCKGRFTNLFHSEDFEILVHYEWTVEISAQTVEALPNAAFEAGDAALKTILEYEAALAAHESQLAKHESYLEYLKEEAAYEAYLEAKETYDSDKALYDTYVAEYNAYVADLACYEEWSAYRSELDRYTDYLAKYETPGSDGKTLLEKWQAYAKELDKVKAMLAPLEIMFVSDSRGWQVYASTMGGTVTSVLLTFRDQLAAYDAEIKAVASEEVRNKLNTDLNNAETATYALRPLLSAYAELRGASYATEHEKYSALYSFYQTNYTALKENFNMLRTALHGIRNNSVFNFGLTVKPEYQSKVPHLNQYIAQLYVIDTCLDDTVSQNTSWTVFKDKTNTSVANLLESVHMLADTHAADPTSAVAPTLPAVAPEYVEKQVKPTEPTCKKVTEKPTAPTPVAEEPILPDPVEKPLYYDEGSEKPDWWEAEHPGDAPIEPTVEPLLRNLAEEIRAGTLKERSAGEPKAITFKSAVLCPISIENLMTVSFYGFGGVLLYRTEVEYGTEVFYEGPDLFIADTPQYSYEFRGWSYADGSPASFFSIEANTSFYANYRETLREYAVTWQIDDKTYQSVHFYGDTPSCPVTPYREETKEYTYAFAGWDKEPAPVSGEATYTARFEETRIEYTVTWVIGEETVEQIYYYGDTPVFEGTPAIPADDHYYTFIAWDNPIEPVKANARYEAQFKKTALTVADTDLSPAEIAYGDGTMTILLPDDGRTALRFDEAVRFAIEEERTLALSTPYFLITLEGDALNAILDSPCKKVRIMEVQTEQGPVYTLQFLTSSGRALGADELSVTGTVCVNLPSDRSCQMQGEGDSWTTVTEDTAFAQSHLVLRLRKSFALEVGEVENCYTHRLPTTVAVGDVIDLGALTCDPGYEITGATVTAADGSTVPLDALSFVMPEGAVTVTLTVEPIVYHVTFWVNGELWTDEYYLYGEEILLPAIPSLPDDETYRYVFIGWSPTILETAIGGDRAPIYTANFSAVLLKTEDPYRDNFFDNIFVVLGLYVLAVFALVAVVILLIRFRKRIGALLRQLREASAGKKKPEPDPDPTPQPTRKRLPWETEEEFLQAVEQERAEELAREENAESTAASENEDLNTPENVAVLENEDLNTPENVAVLENEDLNAPENVAISEKEDMEPLEKTEGEAGEPASEDASADAEGEDPKREA